MQAANAAALDGTTPEARDTARSERRRIAAERGSLGDLIPDAPPAEPAPEAPAHTFTLADLAGDRSPLADSPAT
jgi:hypothetical protein